MITTEASKICKAWDGIAVNFARYVILTAKWVLAKTVLRLAGLKPGMHFLAAASGSGALEEKQRNQVGQILDEKIREHSGWQEPAILEVAVNIGIREKVK